MSNEASILHADVDSFYASVEQRDDPGRGRPVIVGAGVVLAASYEAKAYGVSTPMGGASARRLCPQAVVVHPRMDAYSEASTALFEVFERTTPFVEGLSIDEAFLDVGGLRRVSGTPREIAVRLRRDVLEEVGLPITVGVARTKFLAKVASGVAKPDGLLVVPPDGELDFLHRLPVERLWGVGPVTAAKLRDRSIMTVEQVADVGEATLVRMLGRAAGRHIHALAHNRDPRRVQVGRRRGCSARWAGGGHGHPRPSTPTSWRWSTVSPAGCGRPTGSAAPSPSAAVRRPHTGDAVAHDAGGDPRHPGDPRRGEGSARRSPADDPGAGHHAHRGDPLEPRRRRRHPARAAFRPSARRCRRRRARRVRDPPSSGSRAITRGVLLGRDQGLSVPLLPD